MKLWVGILFLVVSSQLGINARPIPRPINEAIDGFQSNSWEDELRRRNDFSPHDHTTKALSGTRDISSRQGIDDYEIQRFRELQKFIRGELVAEGSYVDVNNKGDDFQTGEEDSRSQETEDNDSLEDRLTGKEFEDDHLTEDDQDGDGENVLETQPKEQEDANDNDSETEHEGEESESIDHYHESVRETRGMSVDDEDEHDEFPFDNVPYYFRPIYTDTAHEEDTAPEHFLYSHEHHLGTENKEADDNIIDDKPGSVKPNSLETQPLEQEDYHVNHMETEYDEALKSMGHDHYGSVREARLTVEDEEDVHDDFPFEHSAFYFRPTYIDTKYPDDIAPEHFVPSHEEHHDTDNEKTGKNADDVREFHGDMRASRESHENTDERNGHETEIAYEGNENPEGSNHYTIGNRRSEDDDGESFGDTYDDVISLATRYSTPKNEASQEKDGEFWNEDVEPEYGENGVPDELMAVKRDIRRKNIGGFHRESHIMSRDDVVDNGGDFVSHDEDNPQEDFAASEGDKDDEDGFFASGSVRKDTVAYNEDEVHASGGNLEETEASDWDEDDEDDLHAYGADVEETEASEWNEADEDNEDSEENEENEENEEYEEHEEREEHEENEENEEREEREEREEHEDNEDNEDNEENEDDEDEFQAPSSSLEETEFSDWDEDDLPAYGGDVDDEDNEDNEDNGHNEDNEEYEDNEDIEDNEDNEEYQDNEGNEEYKNVQNNEEFEDNEDIEDIEDNEDYEENEEYKDNEGNEEYKNVENNEEYEDNEGNEDDEDDEDDEEDEEDEDDKDNDFLASGSDVETTEASDYGEDYQASRDDLEETKAAEWNEDDKGNFEVSEGETKPNMDTAYDANVSGNMDYELVDDVAYAGQAFQPGYK